MAPILNVVGLLDGGWPCGSGLFKLDTVDVRSLWFLLVGLMIALIALACPMVSN